MFDLIILWWEQPETLLWIFNLFFNVSKNASVRLILTEKHPSLYTAAHFDRPTWRRFWPGPWLRGDRRGFELASFSSSSSSSSSSPSCWETPPFSSTSRWCSPGAELAEPHKDYSRLKSRINLRGRAPTFLSCAPAGGEKPWLLTILQRNSAEDAAVNTELTARHVTPHRSGSEEVPLCRRIAHTIAFSCI